jgi:hypothetical protein
MERLSNSGSTVTQLWNPITLGNPEDGDEAFSVTSVRTRATRYKVPEGTYNCWVLFYCHALEMERMQQMMERLRGNWHCPSRQHCCQAELMEVSAVCCVNCEGISEMFPCSLFHHLLCCIIESSCYIHGVGWRYNV